MRIPSVPVCTVVVAVTLAAGCNARRQSPEKPALPAGQSDPDRVDEEVNKMILTSVFEDGALIAKKYTGEGEDLSPYLAWSEVPEGTQSFALICDDPDAPSPKKPAAQPWVHWVICNLPATATELPEGVSREPQPQEIAGALQGRNSWPSDNVGYRGPMPPPGSGPHRYFFKIYALDTQLELPAGKFDKDALLAAMEGHLLGSGQLMGKYERN